MLCMFLLPLTPGQPIVRARAANRYSSQLFGQAPTRNGGGWEGGCTLEGFSVGGGDRLHNLGQFVR